MVVAAAAAEALVIVMAEEEVVVEEEEGATFLLCPPPSPGHNPRPRSHMFGQRRLLLRRGNRRRTFRGKMICLFPY